jgi:hypothetical protein
MVFVLTRPCLPTSASQAIGVGFPEFSFLTQV